MLYAEFSRRAKNLVVLQDENTNIWYLDPDWKDKLCRNGLKNIKSLEDSYITTWADVENILELEVKMRNAIDERKHMIINWLYNIVLKDDKYKNLDKKYIKEFYDYIESIE